MVEFFRFQFLSLLINDVIMASLLLLKTINVSANFIILFRHLAILVFVALWLLLGEKLIKIWVVLIHHIQQYDVKLLNYFNQLKPRCWQVHYYEKLRLPYQEWF